MKNFLSRQVIDAYTTGVNAYIDSLSPKGYPIEYKIFDYAPEPWTPLKCMLLAKSMTWILAGGSTDLQMTNILAKFDARVPGDGKLAGFSIQRASIKNVSTKMSP